MTTEDDFQNAIDKTPEDWQSRLVFADWLEDRSDPRAVGYRAIAIHQRRPLQGHKVHKETNKGAKDKKAENLDTWWWHCPANDSDIYGDHKHNLLPRDWYDLLPKGEGSKSFWPVHSDTKGLMSRRGCEDALALAFSKLPAARQAELLVPPAELANKATVSEAEEKPKTRKKSTKSEKSENPKKSTKPKKRKKK